MGEPGKDRVDGLSPAEGKVMDFLVSAVQAYAKLPQWHPDEADEFVDSLHRLQSLLATRAMARMFPGGWGPDRGEP